MNSKENQKKNEERVYLNSFSSLFPDFPGGKLLSSESPDFIVKLNKKKSIGIELTRLLIDKSQVQSHLDRTLIAECIEKKNKKLPAYRKKRIDIYWLIIVVESLDKSAIIKIHQNTGSWRFQTDFHKIFLFQPVMNQIMEIR